MRYFIGVVGTLCLLLLPLAVFGQPWMNSVLNNPNPNFFEIQRDFEAYWSGKTIEKGKGYKAFKRWEWYWQSRVNEDGSFPDPRLALQGLEEYKQMQDNPQFMPLQQASWTPLGPTTSSGGYAGIGRVNCIGFHPTDANTFYAGSPGGGLWKTTNGGSSWTPLTDAFSSLGVSGIVVQPSNPNVLYIATGDGDGWDTYSIGVMKSTDGGATWSPTGLNWAGSFNNVMRRIIMDPNDESHLLVATSGGLYRTTDAGVSWSQVVSGSFNDVEAQPGASSNNFYASTSSGIYRSTDNGATWTLVQTITGSGRIALAVSAANASAVVALCSKSSDNGFLALYGSSDAGATWASRSTTPNLLGWNGNGSDAGGQGWYDLVVTMDPTNANIVYVGGVNTWKSTNGGSTWSIVTHWSGYGSVATVHADKHALEWQNNTTLFQGNDGGIYRTTNGGTSWTDLTNGMYISQLYKLGVSQTTNATIGGLQDNGTKLYTSSALWSDVLGGDGMECAIDHTNANYMYGELYYGEIYRSSNGGSSWSGISSNITGGTPSGGGWVTPFILSPLNSATIYAGYTDVYRSTDRGNTWTKISTGLSGSTSLKCLAAAPSQAGVIYASTGSTLYRTLNDGTTWSTMTVPSGGSIAYIVVHPANPNTIFMSKSNYSSGQKVYKSLDGGATWTNISGSLPNLPANCITYQVGSSDGLYVGMDAGIYYRDNTLSDWVYFGTGIPNVEITELEIRNSTGKIRAATYGRGLWESDVYAFSTDILTVSPAIQTVTQPAGSTSFNVTSNLNWTLSTTDSWLSFPSTGGSNNGSFTVNVAANPNAGSRTGTVTITAGSLVQFVQIVQAGSQVCTSYASTDVPKSISASGSVTVTSVLPIANAVTITDIDVTNLSITHTYTSDLTVKLKSPTNTEITLLNQICGSNDNILINLDDEAPNTYSGITCPAASNSTNQPYAALSAFDGQSSSGTWTLTIVDGYNLDGGTLNSWNLNVCYLPSVSLSATTTATNVSCNGGNNGSATVAAAGGSGAYTYLWSNGGTSATISNLSAGTYTVTVTSGSNTTTATVSITQPTPLSITATSTNENSGNDGSASVSATGGTAPYSYSWTNGSNAASLNNLADGTYTVTVTDANGCSATASVVVLPAVSVSLSAEAVLCNGGNNGTISSTVSGGNGSYTYSWSNGATTSNLTGLTAGTYTLTVSSGISTAVATVEVTEPQLLTVVATITGVGEVGTTVTGGVSPYAYNWSNNATTPDLSNLENGLYEVTVTDVNGCTASTIIELITLPLTVDLTATAVTCFAGSDGAVSTNVNGGVGAYSYLWSNGETTANLTSLAAGVYTVTVTSGFDAVSVSAIVSEPAAMSVSTTSTASSTGSNGSATATATGSTSPYTYAWSNGSTNAAISGLVPGYYTVTATSVVGCFASATQLVNGPTLAVTTTKTNVTCNGTATGTATATVTGGIGTYSFVWNNGGTTATITGLTAGTYTVTVTSGVQTSSKTVAVTQPAVLNATTSGTNPTTTGGTGTISTSATGGTTPYSYLWSDGATTASVSGVAIGIYTVTVTDAAGCTKTASRTVTGPALSITINRTNVSCNGGSNATASATTTGGTGTYSYVWNTGATTANISGLAAGTYTVTVTSGPQSSSKTVAITQPAVFTANLTVTNTTCGLSNGKITIALANGTAANYLWSNGTTASSITNVAAGTYSVTVTSTLGCVTSQSATVGSSTPLNVALTWVDPSGANNGTITANPSGNIAPYTYKWNNTLTTQTISNLAGGTYTVTVTATGGCTKTARQQLYCVATGNTTAEWIEAIGFGSFANNSGNNGGFGDFTGLTPPTVVRGATNAATFTPGYASTSYSEAWRIWVDNNNDGDFGDSGELLTSKTGTGVQTANFVVPTTATLGNLRMRVAMRRSSAPSNCGAISNGEAEDYLINVVATAPLAPLTEPIDIGADFGTGINALTLAPNPAADNCTISFEAPESGTYRIALVDMQGRNLISSSIEAEAGTVSQLLSLHNVGTGMYIVHITHDKHHTSKVLIVNR